MRNIIIKRVNNGYLVTLPGDEIPEELVIEEDDIGDGLLGRQTAFSELIYILAEEFSLGYDGFKRTNLNVQWNRLGDEIEGEDENDEEIV